MAYRCPNNTNNQEDNMGPVLHVSKDVTHLMKKLSKGQLFDLACQSIALAEGACDTPVTVSQFIEHLNPVLTARDENTLNRREP